MDLLSLLNAAKPIGQAPVMVPLSWIPLSYPPQLPVSLRLITVRLIRLIQTAVRRGMSVLVNIMLVPPRLVYGGLMGDCTDGNERVFASSGRYDPLFSHR